MTHAVVTVVGATGALGSDIVAELLARGAHVRAMVRASSDRSRLERLGVTDFVVADLGNAASLYQAMAAQPSASAVIASAASFTAHSSRTKGNDATVDVTGYRSLIDATRAACIPRFVLISILACDQAPDLPHFRQKADAEQYLGETGQPYIALRAGAFLDRAKDIVPERIARGEFPDILPGVPMALVYSKDLARYAVQAALDLPEASLNRSVDITSALPATGADVAAAFSKVLGRPIVAKPVYPRVAFTLLPFVAPLFPRLRDNLAVLRWLRKGAYVSRDPQRQRQLFGELPTVEEIVARYSRDKKLT